MAKKKHEITAKREKTGTVTDPAVDAKAQEMLVIARVAMLMHSPWYGNIATRFKLINADDWLPTAACDGRNIYYNSEFVTKLRQKEVVFLVAHELLHAIYDHVGIHGRCNGRNPQLWNIATDYAINRDLIDSHCGERITTVPTLYDKRWDGLAAEEIYEKLFDEAEKIDIDSLLKQVLDEHLDGDGDDEEDGKGPGSMSAEERQAIADELREAMIAASQAVQPGQVPANMRRYIQSLTEPQMNWREVLTQQIESQITNDFTYMRPARKGWGGDAILASRKKEPSVQCTVAIDMSGSIGEDMIRDFVGEIYGIMQQHADFDITILTWDCSCYFVAHLTEDITPDELMQLDYKGGGGTSPRCIWNWMEENEHDAKQLLVLTDGYVDEWVDDLAPNNNTVWLIHKNKSIEATNGLTLHYD